MTDVRDGTELGSAVDEHLRSALHHLSCVTGEVSDTDTDWERIEAAKSEIEDARRRIEIARVE